MPGEGVSASLVVEKPAEGTLLLVHARHRYIASSLSYSICQKKFQMLSCVNHSLMRYCSLRMTISAIKNQSSETSRRHSGTWEGVQSELRSSQLSALELQCAATVCECTNSIVYPSVEQLPLLLLGPPIISLSPPTPTAKVNSQTNLYLLFTWSLFSWLGLT